MSIEESEKVVTPDGDAKKYQELYPIPNGQTLNDDECIKLSEPLRIRVDNKQEAGFVVEYAEQCGFVNTGGWVEHVLSWPTIVQLKQNVPTKQKGNCYFWQKGKKGPEPDLIFSDYEQWTAWVDHWTEDDGGEM